MMLAKIVWHRTGDEIDFIPCRPEMFEYYIDCLNTDNRNKFSVSKDFFPRNEITQLRCVLESCQRLSHRIPFEITGWDHDLLDQKYLNQLHSEWVKTGQKHPKIILLLKQLGKEKDFRDINELIHKIETNCCIEFTNYSADPYHTVNPFGSGILDFNATNITMAFDNLGRSSWEKFINHDHNINDVDTNNQNMLTGRIKLNLNKALTMEPPKEYLDWCQRYGLPITGRNLGVGNIPNLGKNLSSLRHILMNNTHEPSDTFFFELYTK